MEEAAYREVGGDIWFCITSAEGLFVAENVEAGCRSQWLFVDLRLLV